ncbi:serine/threonine protein kinase [Ktedonobacter racemifer]|uniref:non-specific serine/threonine protein kinase n=1 Tax=Ktedonobacter racemifer DSM 44963 TaxID=485913 RepID=D6TNN0_KTERA|nr:serine/threonine-protein kinase [Ktedonobacter racemifer]EFH87361.1 serine/threonine protein kinase [Ktedonobacter racemifer DSM 44963]
MNNYGEVPVERALVGQQLGNYRLVKLLGQGGFADVYLGEHIHLQTQAAIKVLRLTLTPENMEGFRKEAQVIAQLEHPHIIRILDYGIERGIPYLVMSYATNGAINRRYPRGTRVPLNILLSLLSQVASALQYAHNQRLIHRDIKPENMLLNRNDEVLLSDFGIALVAQTSRQTSLDIVGTATYMAPEQLMGKPVPASDQYALAIVAYEWLVGRPPFQGSFSEVCAQQLNAPAIDMTQLDPQVMPLPLARVLEIALAKDPQQRYPDVLTFAHAFEQAAQPFLHGTPLPAMDSARLRLPAQYPGTQSGQSFPGAYEQGNALHSNDMTEQMPSPVSRPGMPFQTPPQTQTAFQQTQQRGPQQTPPYSSNYASLPQQNAGQPWMTGKPAPARQRSRVPGFLLVSVAAILVIIGGFALYKPTTTHTQPTPVASTTTTPGTTSVPSGGALYQATWGPEDTWQLTDGWEAQDGQLTSNGSLVNANALSPFHAKSANYAVETEIAFQGFGQSSENGGQNKPGKQGNSLFLQSGGYGIIVRLHSGRSYICGLDVHTGAYIALVEGGRIIKRLKNVGYHFSTGSHMYRVEIHDSEIALLIDGKAIVQASNSTLTAPGEIGLHSDNTRMAITSFKVLQL